MTDKVPLPLGEGRGEGAVSQPRSYAPLPQPVSHWEKGAIVTEPKIFPGDKSFLTGRKGANLPALVPKELAGRRKWVVIQPQLIA